MWLGWWKFIMPIILISSAFLPNMSAPWFEKNQYDVKEYDVKEYIIAVFLKDIIVVSECI